MEFNAKTIKTGSQKIDSSRVSKCNKLLKIADKSIAWWDTGEEYLSEDLSGDLQDERQKKSWKKGNLKPKYQVQKPATTYNNNQNPQRQHQSIILILEWSRRGFFLWRKHHHRQFT